ncbi:uncharacterized protein LOC143006798 isoform X2 [Genypterus blacodes]|uniref:uncharacterized protein LOC143006798 isoform X2 n=1 Tax=Genypterus blacodes TaxID=154954 RepID=UPI003F75AE76
MGRKSAAAASGVYGSCCCAALQDLLDAIRTRRGSGAWSGRGAARLVREPEEDEEEEKTTINNMDISVLREQYRCSRESQKRRTQVLLFRRVSQELSDALSIIPVPQSLTSPTEPQNCSPVANNNPNLLTSDPWHVHLGLHRRSCSLVTNQVSPEMQRTNSYFRFPSHFAESDSRDQELLGDSISNFVGSRETFISTKSHLKCPTGEPVHDSLKSPMGDPVSDSSNCPTGDVDGSLEVSQTSPVGCSTDDHFDHSICTSEVCVFGSSFSDSQESSAASLTNSNDGSTPVASVTYSPHSSISDVEDELKKETIDVNGKTSPGILQASRRTPVPALRFTRQVTLGGVVSSQHPSYYPFPHRKSQRISEAARKLGMYSSF